MQNNNFIMRNTYRLCLWLGLILTGFYPIKEGFSQEICTNGIDDDNDGLIDLNDGDCDCAYVQPMLPIPNPSFEARTCCPVASGRMNCVNDWARSSATTPDYMHPCGFQGFGLVPVPKPIPDGEGYVGFFNGYVGTGETRPFWKEYIGVCLDVPLKSGISYTFTFDLGFSQQPYSPDFDLVFYGSDRCEALPFGDRDEDFGCPSQSPDWTSLARVSASGTEEWVRYEVTIIPHDDVSVLVFGPDCEPAMHEVSAYYYLDNIRLVERSSFEFDIEANGNPCSDRFYLSVLDAPIFDYQWFKDGIALNGENLAQLQVAYGPGIYQVMMLNDSLGCQISREYIHELPVFSGNDSMTICQGDTYSFNGRQLSSAGVYIDTLKTRDECDSILTLDLDVVEGFQTELAVKIFPNESYRVGSQTFNQAGEYEIPLLSRAGCDSLVRLNLDLYDVFLPTGFTPNGDGINDVFTIMGGEGLLWIKNLSVFNRWGNLIFTATNLPGNDLTQGWAGQTHSRVAAEGVYVFTAQLIYDDGKARTVSGSVTLIR
jgi:gliding motility-associated-like protein